MAWTFGDEIEALTGYDANGSDDAISGEDFYLHTNQWLIDGAKEVINMMPLELKEKCTAETTLNNSATTMDMDGVGEILYVNRLSADSGGSRIPCRKVPSMYGELSNDSNSLYKASVTDPVYWILSSSDAAILNVIPTPTANQTAIVYHVAYPPNSSSWDGSNLPGLATSISNFPDEAEYLVVLRAAITAAEYLFAIEEDTELYTPMIALLKAQYQEGIYALKVGQFAPTKQDIKIARAGAK